MSTEPTESGPVQQEPVDPTPEAGQTPQPDQATDTDQADDAQQADEQQPEAESSDGTSVAGAVVGAVSDLAMDVVAGATQALLGRRHDEQADDAEAPAESEKSTEDAAAAEPSKSDEPATEVAAAAETPAEPAGELAAEATPAAGATAEADADAEAAPAESTPSPEPDTEPTDTEPTDTEPADTEPVADEATPAADPPPTVPTPAGVPTPATVPTPAAVPRPSAGKGSRAPTPVAPAAVTPPLAVGAATFGRVDDDGTVHVRDGDEEREVGQYPDVPAEEALAFYVRKFEDLAAQVHLLGQRLDNGTVPAKEARSSLGNLHEAAAEANVVGDLPALRAELARLDGLVAERTATEDAQRQQARAEALAEREAIVTEAEQIAATPAGSMHFKNAGERMATLLETWKSAQRSGTRLDKRTEDPLWKRFAAARSTVDRLRRAHFAQVSEQRSSTKAEKEQLIARAEELQTSTDWRGASDEYRSLMDRWKASGRLARKDDDALWARFRAAQDVFFAARTAANAAEDEEFKANLTVKEALLAEAEALLPVTDLSGARKKLASIQDRWDSAGKVPRGDIDRIETRLRAVIEKVRDAEGAKWGKGKPDVVARGSGLVTQLRQQVADLDAKATDAEARGDSRTAQRAAKERATKQAWLDQAEASLNDLSR